MNNHPLHLQTYAELAYHELRRQILSGDLTPGTKLTVRVLAERLGLSPTPVKAALVALDREGFIVSSAHRGYAVPRTDTTEVAHALELLEALDVLAAQRLTHQAHRPQVVDELERTLEQQRAAPSTTPEGDAELVARASGWQLDFHRIIWEGCGNPRLAQIAENLRGLVLIACGGTLDLPERHSVLPGEHAEMVDALRRADTHEVGRLHAEHFRSLAAGLLEQLAASVDGSADKARPTGG